MQIWIWTGICCVTVLVSILSVCNFYTYELKSILNENCQKLYLNFILIILYLKLYLYTSKNNLHFKTKIVKWLFVHLKNNLPHSVPHAPRLPARKPDVRGWMISGQTSLPEWPSGPHWVCTWQLPRSSPQHCSQCRDAGLALHSAVQYDELCLGPADPTSKKSS